MKKFVWILVFGIGAMAASSRAQGLVQFSPYYANATGSLTTQLHNNGAPSGIRYVAEPFPTSAVGAIPTKTILCPSNNISSNPAHRVSEKAASTEATRRAAPTVNKPEQIAAK